MCNECRHPFGLVPVAVVAIMPNMGSPVGASSLSFARSGDRASSALRLFEARRTMRYLSSLLYASSDTAASPASA